MSYGTRGWVFQKQAGNGAAGRRNNARKGQSLKLGSPVLVTRESQPVWKAVSKGEGARQQREPRISGDLDHAELF